MLNISEVEKQALNSYFNNPAFYTYNETIILPLPDGSKITRPKKNGFRFLYIPNHDDTYSEFIITKNITNDPMQHSAIIIDGKILYLQSKWSDFDLDDMPSKPGWYSPPETEEKSEDRNLRVMMNNVRANAIGVPEVYDLYNRIALGGKKVVKKVLSSEGEDMRMKSTIFFSAEEKNKINFTYNIASELYFFKPLIRKKDEVYKSIELMPYFGLDLHEYLFNNVDELNTQKKEKIILEIIRQYIIQINNKGIVHGDISLANICIKFQEDIIVITFIDYESAFMQGETCIKNNSTPGYTAPELFKIPINVEQQLSLRSQGSAVYNNALIDNFGEHLNISTDIYSLGCVLKAFTLSKASNLYPIINQMCEMSTSDRISINDLNYCLGSFHNPLTSYSL